MNKFTQTIALLCFVTVFSACSKDDDPIVIVPASDGSTLTLNGLIGSEAGASAGNSVFVDFSTDKQTAVARTSWDLGFYSGADFKVILNHSVGATAIALNQTDLTKVTAADTAGLVNSGSLALGLGAGSFTAIDPVAGDFSSYLAGTAIKAISATEADNKVYIVNRGTAAASNRGWEKIRIIRNGNGYTVQYAKINETTFKSINIAKDPAYNFKYISFNSGAVDVEPQKAEWDLQWTYTTYKADEVTPYTYSDFVLINFANGITAAQVIFTGTGANSTVNYANFTETNLAGITFSGNKDLIGSNWRVTSGGPVGVKTDRFYLLKDGAGNIYKLKFNSFHPSDSGVRGKPVVEYKLVKKA